MNAKTPLEIAVWLLGGAAVGGAAYTAADLLTYLNDKKEEDDNRKDVIHIPVPKHVLDADIEKRSSSGFFGRLADGTGTLLPALGGGAAAVGTFMVLKELAQRGRMQDLEEEIEKAREEYMASLYKDQDEEGGAKKASCTPYLDAYCEGFAKDAESAANSFGRVYDAILPSGLVNPAMAALLLAGATGAYMWQEKAERAKDKNKKETEETETPTVVLDPS